MEKLNKVNIRETNCKLRKCLLCTGFNEVESCFRLLKILSLSFDPRLNFPCLDLLISSFSIFALI